MSNLYAIQARLLAALQPDVPILDRLRDAKDAGFEGVEIDLHEPNRTIDEWMHDANAVGIRVSALHYGDASALLHPDPAQRQFALESLRVALTDAGDLHAAGVVIAFGTSAPPLPDLSPYKTRAELTLDLLNEHLRWLEDYANAMDVALFIAPRADSPLMRTAADAAGIIMRRTNHPRIRIAVDADAHADWAAHAALIGCAHIAPDDTTGAAALGAAGYTGWIAVAAPDIMPAPSPVPTPSMPTDTFRGGTQPLPTSSAPTGGTPVGGTGGRVASGAISQATAAQRRVQQAALQAMLARVRS